MKLKLLLTFIACITLFACKEKQKSSSAEENAPPPPPTTQQVIDTSQTYFSISDYFNDQWKSRRGNPYTLLHLNKVNGKTTDSSYVPMDSVLWAQLRAPFDAADISDKKFLGKYKFDMFDDETAETTHLYYEAATPDLFMQKMDISANIFSKLVKAVYIETRSTENGLTVSRKLQYIPDRLFQVQTFEKAPGQPGKNTTQEYRYNY